MSELENEYSGFLAQTNWNNWSEQNAVGMEVEREYAGIYLRNCSEAMIYWKILRYVRAIFSLNQTIRYQLASRKQYNSKKRPLCHFCSVCKEIFAFAVLKDYSCWRLFKRRTFTNQLDSEFQRLGHCPRLKKMLSRIQFPGPCFACRGRCLISTGLEFEIITEEKL